MSDSIPCWIVRGGTSKGVFLLEKDLPRPGPERDRVLKSIMGTPDPGQTDGLGGGNILNSKVAILGPPSRPDADVDYTFAQVGTALDTISYEGSCGNIAAAVGPFAVELGLVRPREGMNRLRLHQVNVRKIIRTEFEVKDGRPLPDGDCTIDGAPGRGARIVLDFAETDGSFTGKYLPLGAPLVTLENAGPQAVDVSLVDLANPVIFVRARDFGLMGNEEGARVDPDAGLLARIEAVRGAVAVRLGLAPTAADAFRASPYLPFICLVAPPLDARVIGRSAPLRAGEIDVTARLIGHQQLHQSFPGTGAAALAAAARTKGSLVAEVVSPRARDGNLVRIGHPSGTIEVEVQGSAERGFERLAFARNWRRILEGRVFLPRR
jgi:2-methylaconitate cis-trans-isomerase PrpF